MNLIWDDDRMSMAQKIVVERFAQNCVAGHLSPQSTVGEAETTIRRSRFDFKRGLVDDREVFGLNEPFSYCEFTKAQVDEFTIAQGEALSRTRVVTTLSRAVSNLARWHDILFFTGSNDGPRRPERVNAGPITNTSLRRH
jgi:hypothetical protein